MDGPYLEITFPLCSAVTLISSILVCSVYVRYPEIQKYIYVKMIVYEIFCCGCSATAFMLGPGSPDGSFACWYQGLVQFYFTVAAALWVLVVSHQLHQTIVYTGTKLRIHINYHYLCWGVPLVTTLLPLTTNTYGEYRNWSVCTVTDRANSPDHSVRVWTIISQFGTVWLTIILNFMMVINILLHINNQGRKRMISIKRGAYILGTHPLILFCCWILITYHVMTDLFDFSEPPDELKVIAVVLVLLQGFFSSVALLWTSKEFRNCMLVELGLVDGVIMAHLDRGPLASNTYRSTVSDALRISMQNMRKTGVGAGGSIDYGSRPTVGVMEAARGTTIVGARGNDSSDVSRGTTSGAEGKVGTMIARQGSQSYERHDRDSDSNTSNPMLAGAAGTALHSDGETAGAGAAAAERVADVEIGSIDSERQSEASVRPSNFYGIGNDNDDDHGGLRPSDVMMLRGSDVGMMRDSNMRMSRVIMTSNGRPSEMDRYSIAPLPAHIRPHYDDFEYESEEEEDGDVEGSGQGQGQGQGEGLEQGDRHSEVW